MMLGSKSNIIKSNTILLISKLELTRVHNHAKMALENHWFQIRMGRLGGKKIQKSKMRWDWQRYKRREKKDHGVMGNKTKNKTSSEEKMIHNIKCRKEVQ